MTVLFKLDRKELLRMAQREVWRLMYGEPNPRGKLRPLFDGPPRMPRKDAIEKVVKMSQFKLLSVEELERYMDGKDSLSRK